MAEVVLFHHAHGLTAGVQAFAHEVLAAGHVVHTPDLFAGHTFDSLDDGVAHVEELGVQTILERGGRAVADLPEAVAYLGMSVGVLPAQQLAQTRPGALGAILLGACVPPDVFGEWPDALPVQVHGMEDDPYFAGEGDLDAARALVEGRAQAELFVYPGDQHLFFDPSLPGHDSSAHAQLVERVLGFLSDVTAQSRATEGHHGRS